MIILYVTVFLLGSCLFWYYGGYLAFLYLLTRIKFKHPQSATQKVSNNQWPFFSIIIPTYNEEKNIFNKLVNTLSIDYPQDSFEVVIVDSASGDRTIDVVRDFIHGLPENRRQSVRLFLQNQRKGKGAAINFVIPKTTGEIVLVTDANCFFDKKVLSYLAPHYLNPHTSAVGGKFQVHEKGRKLDYQNKTYWLWEEKMRVGESAIDSMICMSGEIGSFRKGVAQFDENSTAEDFDFTLRIREAGHRIYYEPKALAFEEVPQSAKNLNIQKKKVVIGTITSLLKHRKMLFNPRFGFYGMVIIPSHKMLQIFSPWLVIGLLICSELLLIHFLAFNNVIKINAALVFLGLATELTFHSVKIVGLFNFWIISQWITLDGWFDFFKGRYSVNWEKGRD